jgi:phage I-like protein
MWKLATASVSTIDKGDTARIQLFPAGWFGAPDGSGQRWFLDAALAQQLIDAATCKQNDYLFDYEHQSLNAPKATGPVLAAGWFKSLTWVEGEGLFADVKWTERAASLIQEDEYRYVSPVFRYDERGNVRELVNAALTNMPVLDGMRQVAASLAFFNNDGETIVDDIIEELRWMLNLPLSSTPEDIKAELQKLITRLSGGQGMAAASISLIDILEQKDQTIQAGETKITALSAAQQSHVPDPTKFVPVGVVDDLRTKLASLSTQIQGDKVDTLMTAALSDGRVMQGADEANLRELGKTDYALMAKMVAARQPIQALSRMQSTGVTLDEKGEPALDADGLAICGMFAGLDEKTFAANLAKELNDATH